MRDYADEIIRYVQKQMTGLKVSLGVEDPVAKEYERREASMKLDDFDVPRRNSLNVQIFCWKQRAAATQVSSLSMVWTSTRLREHMSASNVSVMWKTSPCWRHHGDWKALRLP